MAVIVSDSFNRADSTTTMGSTDSYNGGSSLTWTPRTSGVWGILNNQAYAVSGTNPFYTTVDTGVADIALTVTIPAYVDQFVGAIRVNPANNTGIVFNATGRKLQSFSGSAFTTIAQTSGNLTANAKIKITASGSTITVHENDVLIITATSTINQTLTNHGLLNWRASGATGQTGGTWDSFFVEDLGTGGTTHTGDASLQGVSTITASATLIPAAITGSASLQGVATLSASATVTNNSVTGAATVQGIGTLTATGGLIRSSGANMQGVSTLSASAAGLTVLGGASLTGVSWVMASGVNIKAVEVLRTVNLQGECINAIALQGEFITSVSLIGEMINKVVLEGEI